MDDYISKPVRRDAIRTALEKWLCSMNPPTTDDDDATDSAPEPEMIASLQSLREDGGDEFVEELMAQFVANTRRRLLELRTALARGNGKTAALIAHDIKGSSATFGAVRLADLCRDLENEIQSNSFAAAMTVLDRANTAFEHLTHTLSGSTGSRTHSQEVLS